MKLSCFHSKRKKDKIDFLELLVGHEHNLLLNQLLKLTMFCGHYYHVTFVKKSMQYYSYMKLCVYGLQ